MIVGQDPVECDSIILLKNLERMDPEALILTHIVDDS